MEFASFNINEFNIYILKKIMVVVFKTLLKEIKHDEHMWQCLARSFVARDLMREANNAILITRN